MQEAWDCLQNIQGHLLFFYPHFKKKIQLQLTFIIMLISGIQHSVRHLYSLWDDPRETTIVKTMDGSWLHLEDMTSEQNWYLIKQKEEIDGIYFVYSFARVDFLILNMSDIIFLRQS